MKRRFPHFRSISFVVTVFAKRPRFNGFRLQVAVVLAAVSVVANGGCHCDQETCARLSRCGEQLALQAEACCGSSAQADRDACIMEVTRRIGSVSELVEQLDAACRAGNRELIEILLGRLSKMVSNRVAIGSVGRPTNTLPLLLPQDRVSMSAVWQLQEFSHDAVLLATVNGMTVLAPSAALLAASLATPQALVELSPEAQPEPIITQRWQLLPGACVTWQSAGGSFSGTVVGFMEWTTDEFQSAAGAGKLPTRGNLLLNWSGGAINLALDRTCPFNRVTADSIQVALVPTAVDPTISAELACYPTVWMVLPVTAAVAGQMCSALLQETPGDSLLPNYYSGIAIPQEDVPIPVGGNCGDANGNGIPDLADRIRQSYSRLVEAQCGSASGH